MIPLMKSKIPSAGSNHEKKTMLTKVKMAMPRYLLVLLLKKPELRIEKPTNRPCARLDKTKKSMNVIFICYSDFSKDQQFSK